MKDQSSLDSSFLNVTTQFDNLYNKESIQSLNRNYRILSYFYYFCTITICAKIKKTSNSHN